MERLPYVRLVFHYTKYFTRTYHFDSGGIKSNDIFGASVDQGNLWKTHANLENIKDTIEKKEGSYLHFVHFGFTQSDTTLHRYFSHYCDRAIQKEKIVCLGVRHLWRKVTYKS